MSPRLRSLVSLSLLAGAAVAGAACGGEDFTSAPPTACASTDEAPEDLACTGLYADFASKTLAPTSRHFGPAFPLWSDGYDKDRFISLPDGATIDATAIDDWRFPVGTKVWKEIRRGQRKIETRFFWKVADDRWLQAAYVWSEDGSRATRGEGADLVVDGSPYHVPRVSECNDCHRSKKDKLLGFEAVSLALPGAVGLTLPVLASEGRLAPPPPRTELTIPDPGLGVLHANCGVTCHNASATATAYSTGLRLKLGFDEVASKPVSAWEVFTSAVNVPAKSPGWAGETRITPGAPENSLVVEVMKVRGEGQMPPLATNVVDAAGVAAVEGWIRSLPPTP